MRKYIAKQNIEEFYNLSIGEIGEKVFEKWFKNNYFDEQIFKQNADRDFEKIDFVDEKGYKYQVKTTAARSYTFNCQIEDVSEHLNADIYVFIQIKNKVAYIEPFYNKDFILKNIIASYKYKNCFIYSLDLEQYKIF
jgi:hypothetical protein